MMFRCEIVLGKYFEKYWDWNKYGSECFLNEVDCFFSSLKWCENFVKVFFVLIKMYILVLVY